MPYSRQDFSSGAVFTDTHADQIEENIAAHFHGVNSVVGIPVESGLRSFVYGRILTGSPGSIVSGSFFSVAYAFVGGVTVSFSKHFIEHPAIVGAAKDASGTRLIFNYNTGAFSYQQFNLWVVSLSGTAVDGEFAFTATGAGA